MPRYVNTTVSVRSPTRDLHMLYEPYLPAKCVNTHYQMEYLHLELKKLRCDRFPNGRNYLFMVSLIGRGEFMNSARGPSNPLNPD